MEFLVVGGRELEITGNAFIKAFFDMLFVMKSCLKKGAVGKGSISAFGLMDEVA